MKEPLFVLVGVSLTDSTVRIMSEPMIHEEADACMKMAIARRGLNEEFFSVTPHGTYKDGDKWDGPKCEHYKPEQIGEGDDAIVKIGGMWYPKGPRGLDR